MPRFDSLEDFLVPDSAPEIPKVMPVARPILDATKRQPVEAVVSREGLPANIDAEKTILGAILLDNAAFCEVNEGLNADDFSLDSHRRIFLRMVELIAGQHAIDIVTLAHCLGSHKEVESVGGVAYLASLTEGLPRRPVISEYISIVRDKAIARRVMEVCTRAIARASDQTETGMETASRLSEQVIDIAANTKGLWRVKSSRTVLVGAVDFILKGQGEVAWTVQGLIQEGGNGIIVGDPGSSKSLLAFDLLLHLVAGVKWLGRSIPRRLKCALISREDHPNLTSQRGNRLIEGANDELSTALRQIQLNDCLYLNTRAQTETFSLQRESDVLEIIDAFKEKKIEFAIFDVFRRLWEGDENDNKEVANILAVLTRIQTECKCSVALIHHLSKAEGGIFNRIRGATSIYGWREWAFGISVENPEAAPRDRIRKMVFETKADTASDPVFYKIDGFSGKMSLETCEAPPKETKTKAAKGATF